MYILWLNIFLFLEVFGLFPVLNILFNDWSVLLRIIIVFLWTLFSIYKAFVV